MMAAKTGLHCQVRSNLQTVVNFLKIVAYLVLSLSVCLDEGFCEEKDGQHRKKKKRYSLG